MIKKLIPIVCGLVLAGNSVTHGAIVLSESFTYPDGSLTNVSALKWTQHSGTGGQMDVASGKVNVTETESEDVNTVLDGQPYAIDGGATLYARFKVNFSALPSGTGGYFAHFKDATTSGFRARVFATTTGAAAGSYRLGIANAAGSPNATIDTDLNLNTEYTLVISYGVTSTTSAMWLNPASETDPSVSAGDTTTALPITSFALRQSLSGGNGMGTLTVDDLVVATTFAEALHGPAQGTPPAISAEPVNVTAEAGKTASFNVVASGTEPLAYQWQHLGTNIAGATAAIYTIASAQKADEGTYRVIVSNAFGTVTSHDATLTVTTASGPIVTTIADLHARLDSTTYAPTNTTQLFTVEGVVTTYINLTTDANALFYLQDNTAGIAVFDSGAGTLRPKAGDRVRVTGPLGLFSGLLELNLVSTNPDHSVTILSSGNALPAPKPLEFSIQTDPAQIMPLVGSLVIVTNVTLDLTTPNFPGSSGGNVTMTNANGETFVLRVDARVTDITGQTKPTTPVDIIGVLGQFDSSSPYTSGHQLLPSRFADIIGGAAAPKIEYTNSLSLIRKGDAPENNFSEIVLLPGEGLTIKARAFNADGKTVTLSSQAPVGSWQLSAATGTNLSGTFTYTAATEAAGQLFTIELAAANTQVTNTSKWTIYVPTAAEQNVAVTEFSANAPGANDTPYGNILHRSGTPPNPNSDDEFVELANLGAADVNLRNWTIGDSVQVRHKFYDLFSLPAKGAAVIYGGPLNGFEPQLDVPIIPASENAFGFGLNNSGGDMIIVRNANGNLVARVVYSTLPADSTMTRFPDINGQFVPQLSVSSAVSSPGKQFDGRPFSEIPVVVVPPQITAALQGASIVLHWNTQAGFNYSVLAAPAVNGPYAPVAQNIPGVSGQGEYTEAAPAGARFYRVSVP